MERNDIIKGLECCTTVDACKRCPLYNKPTCGVLLRKNALSLIYKLADENKRLKEKADRYLDNLKAVLDERAEQDVAKEIFEDFNNSIDIVYDGFKDLYVITQKDYDKLIKKHIGEK